VPIVYEENRGWNTLVGSLPFLGVLIGTFVAAAVNIAYSRWRFVPLVEKHGRVAPEHRLPPMMIGQFPYPPFILLAPILKLIPCRSYHLSHRLLPARMDLLAIHPLVSRRARTRLHWDVVPAHLPGGHQLPHRRIYDVQCKCGRSDNVHAVHLRSRTSARCTAAVPKLGRGLGVYVAVSVPIYRLGLL
jgi:hypothetical protein